MPWPKDRKARTRARIVATAASAVRAKGVAGVGVADIMAGAGLTHGGFYAYFPSKDDLLAEAVEYAGRQSFAKLAGSTDSASTERRLHAVIDAYLSPWHLRHLDLGCPVAALGPEVARAGGRMQRNLGRTIRQRLDWLRGLIPDDRRTRARDEQVVGALACMLGGMILARAVGERESAVLLEACRGFLHRALGEGPDKVIAARRKRLTRKPRTA